MNATFGFDPGPRASRPLPVPVPVRNPVTLALFWLSKTDPRLVCVCSRWAMATQAAFGVFVLLSSSLAFGAAYYTLSTIHAEGSLIQWIAAAWAIFYLFLEREVTGSLDKRTAAVRPLLALFIGTLTAVPCTLFVFEERVDQELQRQYRQDNKQQLDDLRADQAKLNQRRADMQTTLGELRRQDAEWGRVMDQELAGRSAAGRTGLRGAGPVFQNAQDQQASARQRIQEVHRDLDQMERSIPDENRRAEDRFKQEEVAKTTDFVTRYEAMDKVIHSTDALLRLSWLITIALILVEMTTALLKILTPQVDYHHLVQAEIRENITRIDEISDRNYRQAMENPEIPRLSVAEKFTIVRYTPVANTGPFERKYETKTQA